MNLPATPLYILAGLLTAALASPATAVVVYDGGGPSGNDGIVASNPPRLYGAAEDFQLSPGVIARRVIFYAQEGALEDFEGRAVDPGLLRYKFWQDGGSVPGTELVAYSGVGQLGVNLSRQATRTFTKPDPQASYTEWEFVLDLDVPFDLVGTKYWFSIELGPTPMPDPLDSGLAWASSGGVVGSAAAFSLSSGTWISTDQTGNPMGLAFHMSSIPVPLPAFMLVPGIAGLWLTRRRRGEHNRE
jgi:hypothetical protein